MNGCRAHSTLRTQGYDFIALDMCMYCALQRARGITF